MVPKTRTQQTNFVLHTLQVLNDELATQKEANTRAPTTTMKNMVERLKNQLSLKEKQQQVGKFNRLLSHWDFHRNVEEAETNWCDSEQAPLSNDFDSADLSFPVESASNFVKIVLNYRLIKRM